MIVSRGLVGPKTNLKLIGQKGNRLIFLYSSMLKLTFRASIGNLVWLFKHISTLENRNGEKGCNV
jgi:hypothetical protein